MATPETNLSNRIRLALREFRLFRNHVGVIKDENGRTHRFGLCKGSSDLIGWRSVEITPEMVGQRIAQFVAIEVKTGRIRVTGPQQRFIDAVRLAGGLALVARSVDDAERAADALNGSTQPRA